MDRISDTPLLSDVDEYAKLENTVKELELFALKGEAESSLNKRINGKTYICEPNNLGMTKFLFAFDGDNGEFRYTNAQGDKILPFGINKNVFGKFPERFLKSKEIATPFCGMVRNDRVYFISASRHRPSLQPGAAGSILPAP